MKRKFTKGANWWQTGKCHQNREPAGQSGPVQWIVSLSWFHHHPHRSHNHRHHPLQKIIVLLSMWSGSDDWNMLCQRINFENLVLVFAKEVWENKRNIMIIFNKKLKWQIGLINSFFIFNATKWRASYKRQYAPRMNIFHVISYQAHVMWTTSQLLIWKLHRHIQEAKETLS